MRTNAEDTNHDPYPSSPGEILKETVFEPLEFSVTEAAERLALSRVLNGKAGISPDLALRLEKAGVSTARFWINLQANYDLWVAMQHEQPPVRPLQNAAA
ncbi:HigA family addiction module antidote protein [Brucella pseudintermedia]|nr:HigA family addiction module antidote protein [Brucella pseudintermedia]